MNNAVLSCQAESQSARTCTRCKGEGSYQIGGLPQAFKCHGCEGRGHFLPVEVDSILSEIKGRKGLRSKRPDSKRAYYVWRLARFHGGVDVTMPVCAMMDVGGDPFRAELDQLAEAVAKHVFGTDMAAAYRWSGLLYTSKGPTPAGLPATAYANGPVIMAEKPESELVELVG